MHIKGYTLRIVRKGKVVCGFHRHGRKETKHELTTLDGRVADRIVTSLLPTKFQGKGKKRYTLQLCIPQENHLLYQVIDKQPRTV